MLVVIQLASRVMVELWALLDLLAVVVFFSSSGCITEGGDSRRHIIAWRVRHLVGLSYV